MSSAEYQREYYRKNKNKIKAYTSRQSPEYKEKLKKSRTKLKLEILQHYSNGTLACKCGFSDVRALCLDHVDGDGRDARQNGKVASGYTFYCKLKREGFPSGLQVLCANCNLIKQHDEGEWKT